MVPVFFEVVMAVVFVKESHFASRHPHLCRGGLTMKAGVQNLGTVLEELLEAKILRRNLLCHEDFHKWGCLSPYQLISFHRALSFRGRKVIEETNRVAGLPRKVGILHRQPRLRQYH